MGGILAHSERYITLTELQQGIKGTLSKAWGGYLWVVAEINDLKINNTGHCYLELADRPEGESSPTATMRGIIWCNDVDEVLGRFEDVTGMELESGMRVLMQGRVNYHEVYGISLYIKDIDPTYTVGEMRRQRQLTVERLKKEGLYDLNSQVERPVVMQRIAVVSSAKAAGYRDFMRELEANEYGYRFDVTLFGAVMQGAGAEASIIEALEAIEAKSEMFDAVVIIRGGGSVTDLSCFDGYALAAAVAGMSLPVIAGIGHDKDVSVVDMVACESVKTPTAAARLLIDGMLGFDRELASVAEFLHGTVDDAVRRCEGQIDKAAHTLRESVESAIEGRKMLLERMEVLLEKDAMRYIDGKGLELKAKSADICLAWRSVADRCDAGINAAYARLRAAVYALIDKDERKIEAAQSTVASFDPARIFALGYGMVRGKGGVLRSTDDTAAGEHIEITLGDGTIEAVVDRITKNDIR